MNELLEGFFEECEELLEVLSDGLDAMAAGTVDEDTINAVFRSVHSIKGGAGAFGMEVLVEFSHAFENVLDGMRSGKIELSPTLVALLYQAGDHLSTLVEANAQGDQNVPTAHDALIADLKEACSAIAPPPEEADFEGTADLNDFDFMPLTIDVPGEGPGEDFASTQYEIRFAPYPSLYEHGLEPVLMLRALGELGDLQIDARQDHLAPLSEQPQSDGGVIWLLQLKTTSPRQSIEQIFEFTRDLCELDIFEMCANGATSETSILRFPEGHDPKEISDGEDRGGDEGAKATMAAETAFAPAAEPAPTSLQVPSAPDASATGSKSSKVSRKSGRDTLRVELDRVDRLVNIVGELVISEAMLRQSMSDTEMSSNSSAVNAMVQLKQLSGELQESVMAIRAQPVRGLFQRMSRIVRETARETGKEACLVTEGDATEVDKTVTERLVEPLTHMIRNAVDHGLEHPDIRERNGKPKVGTVSLSAAHRSGRIQIQLRDDGAGIDRAKVLQTAVRKGLIAPGEEMSEADIDNLLFMPGFSTNDAVSNLSGRGVGMDVVRSEIQALGGRVSISSVAGRGTTFSISLPLTLAVLEGMIVSVAGERIVVPTTSLRETVRVSEASVHVMGQSGQVLSIRDGLIPIVDLGTRLGFRNVDSCAADQSLLLIEADSGRRVALAVDQVFDQREVVIKGLEQNYQQIPGIAAATILGDGRIALIVDTDQMIPLGSSIGEPFETAIEIGAPNHV